MNKLEIVNLTKTYNHKNANENISLTLESGVYGLLGPNGAGKTILMKHWQILPKATPTRMSRIIKRCNARFRKDVWRFILRVNGFYMR